jgi:hypothetical protein
MCLIQDTLPEQQLEINSCSLVTIQRKKQKEVKKDLTGVF